MSDESPRVRRPLRLLALDGGGIRGYAEIVILHNIMHRIKLKLKLKELPKPCDYFDLIGGTSTGGIIAVCLARLRLSTEECLALYSSMSEDIFGAPQWFNCWGFVRSQFDAGTLTQKIKITLKENEYAEKDEDAPMLEPPRETGDPFTGYHFCGGFVTATPGSDPRLNKPRLLRTYEPRQSSSEAQQVYTKCKIWEAVRATSAAPKFFDPIVIDNEMYVDGGFGCNNPAEQVYEEGLTFLDKGQRIGCLVSIGTGVPVVMSMPDETGILDYLNLQARVEPFIRVATDCERTHRQMLAKMSSGQMQGKYYRFNVQQGAQGISLWMWQKLAEMDAHANAYMQTNKVNAEIEEVVKLLIADQGNVIYDPIVGQWHTPDLG